MKIRPFRRGDEEAVIRTWLECGLVMPQNDPTRDIERKLEVNPEWLLVGEIDGEIVATCMVGYEGHRGWIHYLAVKPHLQGHGYGRRLMDHAEDILRRAGCAKINLQVRESNLQIQSFYEHIGYKRDAVVSFGKRLVPDN